MPFRLTDHWTVGHYTQTFTDYHFCVCYDKAKDKAYIWKNPIYKPEDNDNTGDKKYAPHCALGNTGNIGIGVCAMVDFNMTDKHSPEPLNEKQFELMCQLNAECVYKYKFKGITPDTVFTHSEYDALHAKEGKIDIDYLPFNPSLTKQQIHALIRNKTQVYFDRIVKAGGKLQLI